MLQYPATGRPVRNSSRPGPRVSVYQTGGLAKASRSGQRAPNPHPAEDKALQQAGMLLRFAAENAKEVPQNVVSAIAASWEAKDTDRWTPATSSEFWNAFHALCLLIKPVNVDSLAANQPGPAPRPWQIWRTAGSSAPLAKRTARRYLALLFICLTLA